jgi:hypothetical protein
MFALFLFIKIIESIDKLAKLYVNEVVRLHWVSVSIVSYWDPLNSLHVYGQVSSMLWNEIKFEYNFSPLD